jgi:hypothetical protein
MSKLAQLFQDKKDRLTGSEDWFPYPFLISALLAMLFTGHVLLGLNHRLGNEVSLMTYPSEEAKEGAIWFSVAKKGVNLIVRMEDRQAFSWPLEAVKDQYFEGFKRKLKQKMTDLTLSASLRKMVLLDQSLVVMAVDQQLIFKDIKAIIHLLAQLGISEYAFETLQPLSP